MLEKLRALFKVKERQDFRTLFTEPAVSFSGEFPNVPPPDPDLSPMLLAARWSTHDLYGEDMPPTAVTLLEAGYDTPSILRLAAETRVECSADIEPLVTKLFRELSVPYPLSEREANLIFTKQIAREVIAGKRNAWAAASHIEKVFWGRHPEGNDLTLIAELLDSLDWDAVNRNQLPELTSQLIEAFARLAAPMPNERKHATKPPL
jgi:hypothetical protein